MSVDEQPEYGSDEWFEAARQEIRLMPCPRCGYVGDMELNKRMVAKPLGSFSLAGTQMKVSVVEEFVMQHPRCGLRARISLDSS